MIRQAFVCVVCVAFLGACTRSPSPEEQARIQALRSELELAQKEISAAEVQDDQYGGGLLKALVAIRLEILKTNKALLEQQIRAIDSGAKITIETVATNVDAERAKQLEAELTKQEIKASEAEAKASAYSGGLVGAMAMMGAATERNSVAMLRQQYLIAKYGLASPRQSPVIPISSAKETESGPTEAAAGVAVEDTEDELREQILEVTLLRKQNAEQDYQDYVFFDIAFDAKGLDKPARAIKGLLEFTDLFGEQKFAIKWTIDKLVAPGVTYTEKGSGFEYNQFTDSHQWVRNTEKQNMKLKFRVDSILYEDGTTRNFE